MFKGVISLQIVNIFIVKLLMLSLRMFLLLLTAKVNLVLFLCSLATLRDKYLGRYNKSILLGDDLYPNFSFDVSSAIPTKLFLMTNALSRKGQHLASLTAFTIKHFINARSFLG